MDNPRLATVRSWRRLRDEPFGAPDLAEDLHEASKFYESTMSRQVHTARVYADSDLVGSAATGVRQMAGLPYLELPDETTNVQPCALVREPSAHRFRDRRVDTATLGRLMWLSYGQYSDTHPVGEGQHHVNRRPVASAGSLYPLELYILASGQTKRLYHYDPRRHVLEILHDDVAPQRLMVPHAATETASAVVLIMGMFQRSRFKYGLRGYRFVLMEAGAVIHQLQLAAQALGLVSRPYAGVYDDVVEEMVGCDGVDESFINAVLIGHRDG
ncbi:SagB-type dehydrogenase family enzyme [Stackebrandtia endophytica]|uniref:SagB-type dehydrogenase family enzyme n=1 Tax=Stackebrandtia endophytica TaxID=1496996 RepID=A0A543AVZ7_9ACTN|nr:SagB family peptide dehydrogenase [Stackebrandtia endophytica]TQL76721.1 SagB-type dehydrogenase family enzyme [Stackebrandtia endophytica]